MRNIAIELVLCLLCICSAEQITGIGNETEKTTSSPPKTETKDDKSNGKIVSEEDKISMLQAKVREAMQVKKSKIEAQVDDNMMASELIMNLNKPEPVESASGKIRSGTSSVKDEVEEVEEKKKKAKKKKMKQNHFKPAPAPAPVGLLGLLLG